MIGSATAGAGAIVESAAAPGALADRWVRRRVGVIWTLLFLNALGSVGPSALHVPKHVEQVINTVALFAALLLALSLNRRLLVRPNLILGLTTLLLVISIMACIHSPSSLGTVWRTIRFSVFIASLWLLTPWWGRADLLIARCHLRAMIAVCASVVVGLMVFPSHARADGRLSGVLWPVPPTQVAEYAALAAGMTAVLWLSGWIGNVRALTWTCGGVALVLLTETRTALLALAAALAVAALTLSLSHRRVRRVVAVSVILTPTLLVALSPLLSTWAARGQSATDIDDLTGRRQVWTALLEAPRSGVDRWIGLGLSNKSFGGLSIDNDWLAVYQDQGLAGDGVIVLIFLILLLAPAFRPAGAARAIAAFIGVYCVIASYTEVGLGDATPYLLHAAVAGSLLLPPPRAATPVDDAVDD